MQSGRQFRLRSGALAIEFGGRSKPSVAIVALVALTCLLALLFGGERFARAIGIVAASPAAASSATDVDALGIPYASRLTNGTSASAQTRLFDDARDRQAQIDAVREDDAYAADDSEHAVGYAENRMLFAVCSSALAAAPAVQCSGRTGYILHLALRGDLTDIQEDAAIDRYGAGWAAIFARYHPGNAHCALVILSSDATAEDASENDDDGNAILRRKCFALPR